MDAVRLLHIKDIRLSVESLHKYPHFSPECAQQAKSAFLLNVVVRNSSFVLETFLSKREPLLIHRDALMYNNTFLDLQNAVSSLDFKSNCHPCESSHEDLQYCNYYYVFHLNIDNSKIGIKGKRLFMG